MRSDDPYVIAIACSDIHLSDRAPTARSAEENWYAAMERPLFELMNVWVKNERAPILIAGDIFHKPDPPPALISFALRMMPLPASELSTDGYHVHAIPGQHDLPFHSMKDIEKTAFHVLEMTERIDRPDTYSYLSTNLGNKNPVQAVVHAFPWGTEASSLNWSKNLNQNNIHIALVHAYCWREGHSHPGAPEDKHVDAWRNRLEGYDLAIFGDNHRGFLDAPKGKMPIINCGAFMRRRIDEIDYEPRIWLIYSDLSIKAHKLDCSEDKFIDVDRLAEEIVGGSEIDLSEFAAALRKDHDKKLNFRVAVKRLMRDQQIGKRVTNLILGAMGPFE